MERSAAHTAADRAADDHGDGAAAAPARGRDIVGERLIRAGDEIHKLHLDNGSHAHVSGARSGAGESRFADGRVDHAIRSEAGKKTVRDLERAAIHANVLAEQEDVWVALHLFPKRF